MGGCETVTISLAALTALLKVCKLLLFNEIIFGKFSFLILREVTFARFFLALILKFAKNSKGNSCKNFVLFFTIIILSWTESKGVARVKYTHHLTLSLLPGHPGFYCPRTNWQFPLLLPPPPQWILFDGLPSFPLRGSKKEIVFFFL